ncbi:DUF2846 domain-containing protein [Photobacterium profundum]|uniref:DUF2846 domain-containing protein n=1 Tax=Photobacterium profundum 3TCK TaxID=314280 RepID=Q1Z3E8_9GAMM|nr:DUF2846 domain-containing protein [Photobacterium profundum]EAS43058.1 hypothetical protein P3TCK_11449 [Photobacterium profundum 3TCK]PSV61989.1 DUF2846 domain-containing protein [Photobacterium profundum]
MFKQLLMAGGLALFMTGCASVPMADSSKDAELKGFEAPSDVAGVYIYRNETLGAAITMDVDVNDKPLGSTAANTYLYTELPEGKHVIKSEAENTSTLEVDVANGRIYYIWQEVKMGIMSARSKLQQVDEVAGQNGVNESKLAVSNY